MSMKLGLGLKVDLSDQLMKISEASSAPMSNRPGANNALAKEHCMATTPSDCTVSKQKYAVSLKQGNFRRT